jgi:adenylate kinase family enzyme
MINNLVYTPKNLTKLNEKKVETKGKFNSFNGKLSDNTDLNQSSINNSFWTYYKNPGNCLFVPSFKGKGYHQISSMPLNGLFELPIVIEARKELTRLKSEIGNSTLNKTEVTLENGIKMNREVFRERIASKLYLKNRRKARQEGKAYIIVGISGGGKSSIARSLGKDIKALIIDHDNIKDEIPEFSHDMRIPGIMSKKIKFPDLVHPESLEIQNKILAKAAANYDNVIVHISGRREQEIMDIRQIFKHKGYKEINLIAIDVDREEATRRTVQRFIRTGRFLDPMFVYKRFLVNFLKPEEGLLPIVNFNKLKDSFDHFTRYSNMVEMGEKPQVIEGYDFLG